MGKWINGSRFCYCNWTPMAVHLLGYDSRKSNALLYVLFYQHTLDSLYPLTACYALCIVHIPSNIGYVRKKSIQFFTQIHKWFHFWFQIRFFLLSENSVNFSQWKISIWPSYNNGLRLIHSKGCLVTLNFILTRDECGALMCRKFWIIFNEWIFQTLAYGVVSVHIKQQIRVENQAERRDENRDDIIT